MFGVNLAFLVGGTVIVENVFSIPGLGSLLVNSVSSRDFPVVQALTLFFAVFVLVVNLVTDWATSASIPAHPRRRPDMAVSSSTMPTPRPRADPHAGAGPPVLRGRPPSSSEA